MSDVAMKPSTCKHTPDLPFGNAICYSGYRLSQDPRQGKYPSYWQIKQDLENPGTQLVYFEVV